MQASRRASRAGSTRARAVRACATAAPPGMRWWTVIRRLLRAQCSMSSPQVAIHSKSPHAARAEAALPDWAAAIQQGKGLSMLGKLIVAVVLTVIAGAIPETRGYAVWVFFIAVVAAFVV